jgi:hypothetical protein
MNKTVRQYRKDISTFDAHHLNGEFCPVRFACPHGMEVCEHFMCGACQLVTEYNYGTNPQPKRTFRIRLFGRTLFELTSRRKRGTRAVRELARKLDYDVRYTLREQAVQKWREREDYGAWSDDGSNRTPQMADAQAAYAHGSWGAGEGEGYASQDERIAAGKWIEPKEIIDHMEG